MGVSQRHAEWKPVLSHPFVLTAGERTARKSAASQPFNRWFPLRNQVWWGFPPSDIQHSRYSFYFSVCKIFDNMATYIVLITYTLWKLQVILISFRYTCIIKSRFYVETVIWNRNVELGSRLERGVINTWGMILWMLPPIVKFSSTPTLDRMI